MTPRARRAAIVAGVGVAVAAALALLRGSYALQALELKTLDLRFRTLADPARADSNIVVLDADNLSLELLRSTVGRWPWPRDVWAAVTRYASAGGARAIGFDFNFADPDLAHPGADEAFAEAAAAAGVVVQGLTLQQVHDSAEVSRLAAFRQDTAALRYLTDVLGRRVDGVPASRNVFQLVEHPYRALLEASRNVGSINYTPDPVDGTARRVPLVSQYRNATFLAFALATALTADSARMLGCGRPPAWTSEALRFCDVTIPLDDGAMLINWHGRYRDAARGRETYRIIPVAAVLKSFDEVRSGATPEVPLATFRGKVVLVGASGSGLFDARPNPFDPADPGVLIHATVVDNILNRDFLRRASPALNLAALFGGALLAAGIVAVLPTAAASVAAMLALLALEVAAGFGLFSRGLWLDTAAPSLAILVTFTGGMVVNYVTEGRQKKQIRDMFSKYVAPEYVAQLAEDPSALHLEGRRAELSILFSDIRGFTSISEKMQPAEVVGLLNDYLTEMAALVKQAGGTLDKFIGDAVMAFWGEPVRHADHARRACDCALAMRDRVAELGRQFEAQGRPALRIGIGINTAEVVVGNIGSLEHKLDYTVIGDGVNLASRLEGQNKEFGTTIIVSEFTVARTGGAYDVRPLGEVKVKGKESAVAIFELLGRKSAP